MLLKLAVSLQYMSLQNHSINYYFKMSDKEFSLIDTNDETFETQTPPRRTQSQSSSAVAARVPEPQLFVERMLSEFKEEQLANYQHRLNAVKKGYLQVGVVVVASIVGVLVLLVLSHTEVVNRLEARVGQLEHREKVQRQETAELYRLISSQKDYIKELHQLYEGVREEIYDMHMSELLKEQKSMHVLMKYSTPFKLNPERTTSFIQHFRMREGNFRKKSDEVKMFYSDEPLLDSEISYLRVEVVETLYSMISVGVMSSSKRDQDCVYCDASDMIYFFCSNGAIYNGKMLNLIPTYRSTHFDKVSSGDVLTLFFHPKEHRISWYVNSRFAGTESTRGLKGPLYPFVEMTSRGDEIRILS